MGHIFEGFGTHFGSILRPKVVKNVRQNAHEVKGGLWEHPGRGEGGQRELKGVPRGVLEIRRGPGPGSI